MRDCDGSPDDPPLRRQDIGARGGAEDQHSISDQRLRSRCFG